MWNARAHPTRFATQPRRQDDSWFYHRGLAGGPSWDPPKFSFLNGVQTDRTSYKIRRGGPLVRGANGIWGRNSVWLGCPNPDDSRKSQMMQ